MDHERCPACGFDGARLDDGELLGALRALGGDWHGLLVACGTDVRVRPEPDTWSALEYAAHSRDVTSLHVFGVEQALRLDEPSFPAIDGEALISSAAPSYLDADPDQVVKALGEEAGRLAQLADEAGRGAWGRGLTIGESRLDVRRLLEHALHDSRHHLGDVERGRAEIEAARARRSTETASS